MQTSGQFGVPPSEVPSQYTSVSNTASNTSNRSTSTPGSNQALGHMLFNLSNHDQQHPSLSSPAPYNPHSSAAPSPVLLGKSGLRDGGAAEPFQGATPARQQQQQQHHQFSHFLQVSAAPTEQYQVLENAGQEQIMQQKQGNSTTAAGRAPAVQTHAQVQAPTSAPDQGRQDSAQLQKVTQSMHLHNQLSLGLDQSMSEGNMPSPSANMKVSDNQLNSADPISLGDIDQAEEGAGAGNRWPRQETLALLKIRADMDAAFRDTSVKRPLWDEVSRKLGELGYDRSAKKCKEKFENVNKYYKRTKDGKVGRQDGKNYRFFTQLEALQQSTNPINNTISTLITPATMLITNSTTTNPDNTTTSSSNPDPSHILPPALPPGNSTSHAPVVDSASFLVASSASVPPFVDPVLRPPLFAENAAASAHFSSQSSSDDDDDDDDDDDEDDDVDDEDNADDEVYDDPRPRSDPPQPSESKKRKRKTSTTLMAFFEGLLKKVIDKQEQMQEKFLQALERRESDRMIREEAWRRQEMARLSKEHELRAQERNSAASRDAALLAFLQKVTGQNVDIPQATTSMSVPIAAQPVQSAPPLHQDSGMQYEDQDASDPNSKRWLKPEVLALIDLHSNLQAKFTEAGPKGPLWEEIATGMTKLGYSSRNAKRCKEKWENINKYFKRAKESNKKRPENAKTCPYFHELDALYRKGLLGASNSNQLPYKPSIDHADESVNVHQHSIGNRESDCARLSQMQLSIAPSEPAPASAAATSLTSNSSAAGAGDAYNSKTVGDSAMRNVNDKGGGTGLNAVDHMGNRARGGFTAELGLNLQQQSTSMDLHPQKQVNQGEFGKMNARGEAHAQADTPAQSSKESKPSLAPLPNSSSFMANMLQKLNGSSTAGNNNSTSQDQ